MVKDNNKRLVITIPSELLARLEDLSRETGISKSVIINIALAEKLDYIKKVLH